MNLYQKQHWQISLVDKIEYHTWKFVAQFFLKKSIWHQMLCLYMYIYVYPCIAGCTFRANGPPIFGSQ